MVPLVDPVLPPVAPPAESPPPPRLARMIPPTAAPPTAAAIAIHLFLLDVTAASAFVWVMVALAASPRHDAVARIRNGPSIRLGMSPRPVAIPRSSVGTVKRGALAPNVAVGPVAGRRKETVALFNGSPEESNTW